MFRPLPARLAGEAVRWLPCLEPLNCFTGQASWQGSKKEKDAPLLASELLHLPGKLAGVFPVVLLKGQKKRDELWRAGLANQPHAASVQIGISLGEIRRIGTCSGCPDEVS